MAIEQTFRSPAYYDTEIDKSVLAPSSPQGIPAGVIGTSNKGPAFVPMTVGSFSEFQNVFGPLNINMPGPYAANEWLKNRPSLTYMRVLGGGANTEESDVLNTQTTGRVKSAGFKLEGNVVTDGTGRHSGAVQYIVAKHALQANEAYGLPLFSDNDSFGNDSTVRLVRGVVFLASGARMMVLSGSQNAYGIFTGSSGIKDTAPLVNDKFKLVISSSLGNTFANTDNNPGVKIYTASFNPTSDDYFGKLLNTDPSKFVEAQHLLYADYAVDAELAIATTVGVLSGSALTSTTSAEPATNFRQAFGAYDTRFKTPSTPSFISQPFGKFEYDLFSFEPRDDGEYANKLYKISISNLKASADESSPYGTFTVEIRDFTDTDTNPVILERFPQCSLNPADENYVARKIGDKKAFYNFDATTDAEQRVITTGKYLNQSKYVRIVMNTQVEQKKIPKESLPFGFRGYELLKTTDSLTHSDAQPTRRLAGLLSGSTDASLNASIVPPIPFRYKVTKGAIVTPTPWAGAPGPTESATSKFYWGVKFERNTNPLNVNISSEANALIEGYTKFTGIKKLDTLVTGSGADILNNNKFSLANVVLSNATVTDITGSVTDHMREAVYVRNAALDGTEYTYVDPVLGKRVSMATVLSKAGASVFNRFIPYNKFTCFMAGGYDGLNILDVDNRRMNDKSTSFDAGGGAEVGYVSPGMLTNVNGTGQDNANVVSYRTAANIMTNPLLVNHNVLAIPGIRESYITDGVSENVRDYGYACYIMDIPKYDDVNTRLYDDSTTRADSTKTASNLESRVVDNNYVCTYFPDVIINDTMNNRKVKVPASVAALGAFGFNDKVAYPWFAPAGFNRASLDFVTNVDIRLNLPDRDSLYESRINPIATFPRQGFVIYGQKTLQLNDTLLSRINVRRVMLEVKRIIADIANKIVFEANNVETRNTFVKNSTLELSIIKTARGVEGFDVVMNETNNTPEDVELNRMNGTVYIRPTKSVEFITMDFVVTNSGAEFTS